MVLHFAPSRPLAVILLFPPPPLFRFFRWEAPCPHILLILLVLSFSRSLSPLQLEQDLRGTFATHHKAALTALARRNASRTPTRPFANETGSARGMASLRHWGEVPQKGEIHVLLPNGSRKWVKYRIMSGRFPNSAQLSMLGVECSYLVHTKQKRLLYEAEVRARDRLSAAPSSSCSL